MVLRDMEKRAAKRCQAWNSGERIADVPHPPYHWQMDAIFSPVVAAAYSIIVQAMTCALSPPSFCPIVSSRVLIQSCCFFSQKKARNTYHDRTSAFTLPLLRGLGYLPAASCRGHRAPYRRAACLAPHATTLVDWHVRDAYCRKSRLVVPRTDGRGERRSYFPGVMGSGNT